MNISDRKITDPHPVTLTIERSDVHECIEVLTELCDDLSIEINSKYAGSLNNPTQARRYHRDMTPVHCGLAMVEKLKHHGKDQQP